MAQTQRRQFLANVGEGMLAASLGAACAAELGFSQLLADEVPQRLRFGKMEPLVALMQDTEPEKLQPVLVDKIRGGTPLKRLVAAGALANARSFGGQD